MKRREFISVSGKAMIGVCCLGISTSSCTSIHYASHELSNDQVQVKLSEFENRKFIVVDNDNLDGPIYITKNQKENNYKALSMICTHKGCVVDPAGNILVCPCHGAEFSNTGKVLGGPTNVDLPEYKIIKTGNTLTVKLK